MDKARLPAVSTVTCIIQLRQLDKRKKRRKLEREADHHLEIIYLGTKRIDRKPVSINVTTE